MGIRYRNRTFEQRWSFKIRTFSSEAVQSLERNRPVLAILVNRLSRLVASWHLEHFSSFLLINSLSVGTFCLKPKSSSQQRFSWRTVSHRYLTAFQMPSNSGNQIKQLKQRAQASSSGIQPNHLKHPVLASNADLPLSHRQLPFRAFALFILQIIMFFLLFNDLPPRLPMFAFPFWLREFNHEFSDSQSGGYLLLVLKFTVRSSQGNLWPSWSKKGLLICGLTVWHICVFRVSKVSNGR